MRSEDLARRFAAAFVVVLAVASAIYLAGARVNLTRSAPLGLYWTSRAPITQGEYVAFCPPRSKTFDIAKLRGYIGAGFCPSGYGYLIKRVLAAKGDDVDIQPEGIQVNGVRVPHSAQRSTDLGGRTLPLLRLHVRSLPESALLLLSDSSDTSFDARYFGLSDRSQVMSVLQPVWTF